MKVKTKVQELSGETYNDFYSYMSHVGGIVTCVVLINPLPNNFLFNLLR